jgi:hypothetical protein
MIGPFRRCPAGNGHQQVSRGSAARYSRPADPPQGIAGEVGAPGMAPAVNPSRGQLILMRPALHGFAWGSG